MKNDIRNLHWPGLYNVTFVHNCSGSMLSRSDKYTNFRPAGSRAPKLSKFTLTLLLGINNFSVLWIENLSNIKHFHISAMSNNYKNYLWPTMSFCGSCHSLTATRPSRRRSFDRFNYSPSKGETD